MEAALFSSQTWFFIDSHGFELGPFRPVEMWRWYNDGYFPPDLMVRCTIHSTFTRIASLVQPIVNFGPPAIQQYVTRKGDGNHSQKIKEEGEDREIKEEDVGLFLKPKEKLEEERSGRIEVNEEYKGTEIKDEYIKSEVHDKNLKSVKQEVKDECKEPKVKNEYIKSEVKREYMKVEVKDEYIKPEVKDKCIKPEVHDKNLKSVKQEVKDDCKEPNVKNEYIKSEVKREYMKLEVKDEYIEHELKEESLNLAASKQIVILKDKYKKRDKSKLIFKKGDVFTITKLSNSGKSLWLTNGIRRTCVLVKARGSLYDIFIPTGIEENKPLEEPKIGTGIKVAIKEKSNATQVTRAPKNKKRRGKKKRQEKKKNWSKIRNIIVSTT